MPLFTPEFVARCEAYDQAARTAWGSRFLGRKIDRRLLAGTQATSTNDYATGDEYRYIDWNRCARLDELVSRRFEGREDQQVHLLVDCSASMQEPDSPKFQRARELAAALGYLALASGATLRVMSFAADVVLESGPIYGRSQLPKLARYLEGLQVVPGKAPFLGAMAASAAKCQPGALAVIVSDFLGGTSLGLALAEFRRRQVQSFLVQLFDPADADPALRGGVLLVDSETGEELATELDPHDLAHYREVFREFREGMRTYCVRTSNGLASLSTDLSLDRSIETILRTAARLE